MTSCNDRKGWNWKQSEENEIPIYKKLYVEKNESIEIQRNIKLSSKN